MLLVDSSDVEHLIIAEVTAMGVHHQEVVMEEGGRCHTIPMLIYLWLS